MSELRKQSIAETRRLVIKVGSKLLVHLHSKGQSKWGVNKEYIQSLAKSIVALRKEGMEVVLVSSGAVGAGMSELKMEQRPKEIETRQACASVGQVKLMHTYEKAFREFDVHVGQVLVGADDFRNRERYLNIHSTVNALLNLGCVPIVNENDTVAVEEIKVGDNDKLSADITQFLDAQMLMIFTDEDGLYDKNPKTNPDALVLSEVERIDDNILNLAEGGRGSEISTGGMQTKLEALRQVTESGCAAILANGTKVLPDEIVQGSNAGSFFVPRKERMPSKDRWLSFVSTPAGVITVDQGAQNALQQDGSSLLVMGISKIEGHFRSGDLVAIQTPTGVEVARGAANSESGVLKELLGMPKEQRRKLPKRTRIAVHRNNMVVHND